MNRWISISLLAALSWIFFACQPKVEVLPFTWEGSWKATWESPLAAGQEVSGYFHFKEEGKVEIQAFGHAQSALLSDTTRHTAPWFVQGSELIIGNSHPLTYQVISQSPTHVRLLLLEEIQVSLIRVE